MAFSAKLNYIEPIAYSDNYLHQEANDEELVIQRSGEFDSNFIKLLVVSFLFKRISIPFFKEINQQVFKFDNIFLPRDIRSLESTMMTSLAISPAVIFGLLATSLDDYIYQIQSCVMWSNARASFISSLLSSRLHFDEIDDVINLLRGNTLTLTFPFNQLDNDNIEDATKGVLIRLQNVRKLVIESITIITR
jgi:hypothetical protein